MTEAEKKMRKLEQAASLHDELLGDAYAERDRALEQLAAIPWQDIFYIWYDATEAGRSSENLASVQQWLKVNHRL
jgi:hypothetical protein